MSRVSVSDPCHRCGHRYSEHGAAHDTQCFCDQFIAAPDFEDKMLTTVENIEEQLKRLNATMDRIEPFLAANRTKNAPTAPQEAQEPREDLKPVVREGDEEFSALAARLFESLRDATGGYSGDHWANARRVLREYAPLYEDYKAQQCDHDQADREDAER